MTLRTCLIAMLLSASLCASDARAAGVPTVIRSATSVLLQVEPGTLSLTLSKRDLNIYPGPDVLTASLVDPQRRTIATVSLPDDGKDKGAAEETQSETVQVRCDAAGVYRLMFSTSGDLVYGFDCTCSRYVMDGDIMLNDGAVGGTLYFKPPAGAFDISLAALHEPGLQELVLRDAAGEPVASADLRRTEDKPEDLFGKRTTGSYVAGSKLHVAEGQGDRSGVWSLPIDKMDVRVAITGVRFWTAEAGAWFDPEKSRWLLMPYAQLRYLQPGDVATVECTLRNRSQQEATFALGAGSPDGLGLRITDPGESITVPARESRVVRVEIRLPEGAQTDVEYSGMLTAAHSEDPDVRGGARILARRGQVPAQSPLQMPIVLQPYRHENLLFGYAPDYTTNEVYFDPDNRPYIRQRTESAYPSTGIEVLTDEGWVQRSYMEALKAAFPDFAGVIYGAGFLGAKVAFDGQGGAYTLLLLRMADNSRVTALVFTSDESQSYQVYPFRDSAFDIEQFTGHNALQSPPPILAYTTTAPHHAEFCSVNDLELYLPRREGDRIVMGEPVLVSKECLGSCQHSGGPASTVTRDGKTHIVWGEVAPDDTPGVPQYVCTYEHATGRLGEKVFLAYGPPVNDVHNVPAITMDSEGYLHILTGAHGDNFMYLKSLRSNDADGGFTEPVEALSDGFVSDRTDADGDGRQTYISLVCGPDDTLYSAFRQWRQGVDPYHGGRIYAALSYQRKPKDGPWESAKPLVVPPLPDYSIYYHKLTIDRLGRLFLAYCYYTAHATYQGDFPERQHHQAVLMSPDGGDTWKLAAGEDFAQGIRR